MLEMVVEFVELQILWLCCDIYSSEVFLKDKIINKYFKFKIDTDMMINSNNIKIKKILCFKEKIYLKWIVFGKKN